MIGGGRLRALSEKLDVYSSMLILMAISILRWSNNRLRLFCDNYGLKRLVRQPIYYKSPSNPTHPACDVVAKSHFGLI